MQTLMFANHYSYGGHPPPVFFNITDNYGLLVTLPDAQYGQTIDVYTKTPIHINLEVRTNETILLIIASFSTVVIVGIIFKKLGHWAT